VALAGEADAHRVDAVLEAARGIELEVGGGKAEFAAALGAVDDLDGDEPRRAQEFGRFHHLALAQRHADGAGGHRSALVLERRTMSTAKPRRAPCSAR